MPSINILKSQKNPTQEVSSGQKVEHHSIKDLRISSDIVRDHLDQPHHLETSRQEVIEEDKTKEDCDTSVFSFTFNKEEHQRQVNDETKSSKKQMFSNSFKVGDSIDSKLQIQNEHTHSKTPQLLKVQGKQNNRNCQLDLQLTEQTNLKRGVLILKKIEFEQFPTKNRPISQVQVRHVSNDGLDNNYNEEYSYNIKSKVISNVGDQIKVVQSRASSSKVRPTSGMQHYLKGKLPDCFLIESSPLSRKQPMNEAFAYIESTAIERSSPFTVKAASDEQNTRLHSAQTYIRNSSTETDNKSKQRLSVLSNKPPLIPNLGNPKRLMSGNSATQASYMNSGSMQTTAYKKPVVSKQGVDNLYNRNDQRLMQEILKTSLSPTLMNPDQFERAAPNTSYTERY